MVFDYAVPQGLCDECPAYERFGRGLAEYHLLGAAARLTEQLILAPEERYRALLVSGKTKILERVPQRLEQIWGRGWGRAAGRTRTLMPKPL